MRDQIRSEQSKDKSESDVVSKVQLKQFEDYGEYIITLGTASFF